MSVVSQVKESLSLFRNLYDIFRIIDPVSKKVVYVDDDQEMEKGQPCFCFWEKGSCCSNCVAMRAEFENDTFIKLESKKDKIYMVISTPVSVDNNKYIVELIKDISDKGFLNGKSILKLSIAEELITEMNDKIIRDGLTGIYNKRYINERLPIDINKSSTEGQPLSIIMADIDLFKDVNDTYGHSIGDKILIDFAKLLEKSVRKNIDWVGRFGGEEFLIVLKNTDVEDAYGKAENIRVLLEDTIFKYDNLNIKITSSFGVYSTAGHKFDAETLIANSDKNLYKAKNSGRNKTVADI